MYKIMLICITLCAIVFSSCGQSKATNIASSFENIIIETVKENYEDGEISVSDIVVSEIYYGTFSQSDAKEMLVVCNILNLPHVAGLDKSICILLTTDSLEVKSYKEFASDETVIKSMLTEDGFNRILVSRKTTYQGVSTQDIQLFSIQENQWVDIPIDVLNEFEEEQFFLLTEDLVIVTSKSNVMDVSDIVAILEWNPKEGTFSLK